MQSRLPVVAALVALSTPALAAQTADQARLVFSIGLGQTSGGGQLWRVGNQPLGAGDTVVVNRALRNSLNISFGGTYFPSSNLGFNAEAQLLGLGTRDGCTVVSLARADSLTDTDEACASLNSKERGTSSGALSVGMVYRVFSRSPIHPYVRANVGMVVSQESFIQMIATIRDSNGVADKPVYLDDSPDNIQPYFSFGGGIVTAISRGYQLRFEIRDNWVRVPVVTGPTRGSPAFVPAHATKGRHVLSFLIGFDVVLERKRGRRY